MEFRTPWDPAPTPPLAPLDLPESPPPPKRRGRRPAATRGVSADMAAASAWRYHHLTISGPTQAVSAFATAACGAGIVPWTLDFGRIEEDIFNLAAAQPPARRSLTVAGCHILARHFRGRAEAHQAKAISLVGHGRACPFDLHTLLPVPQVILQLGPTHPTALTWLSKNWGLTDTPRQVARRSAVTTGRRLPAGHGVIGYSFFTAGETPHAAIAQLGPRWPTLRFVLQPRPLD